MPTAQRREPVEPPTTDQAATDPDTAAKQAADPGYDDSVATATEAAPEEEPGVHGGDIDPANQDWPDEVEQPAEGG